MFRDLVGLLAGITPSLQLSDSLSPIPRPAPAPVISNVSAPILPSLSGSIDPSRRNCNDQVVIEAIDGIRARYYLLQSVVAQSFGSRSRDGFSDVCDEISFDPRDRGIYRNN